MKTSSTTPAVTWLIAMSRRVHFVTLLLLCTLIHQPSTSFAQGTAFTYQGQLSDSGSPAGGSYDLRFAIYDASSDGTQQGVALTNAATAVSNGLFTVTLDFGNQFPGADRWLEIGVVSNGGGAFNTLAPRQHLTATPYAIQSGSASNLLGVLSVAQLSAGTAAIDISGSATSFTGSLSGNVTGPQAATVVSTVGGVTAANVASGANAANAATSVNTASTIVRRDAGGSFSAGSLTLSGNLNLPATTASAGIIKANGTNVLHSFGSRNIFVGANAGNLTLPGNQNTGVGFNALLNSAGSGDNTAVGAFALASNTTGNRNTAVGMNALLANTNGVDNTAIGAFALTSNTGGNNNTASGVSALTLNNLGNNNTAYGAYALSLNMDGMNNTASGFGALNANTTGSGNTANGMLSLYFNTTGTDNTVNGRNAMLNNTTGSDNTASGTEALNNNNTGSANTALGRRALYSNTNGGNNTASGWGALQNNTSGSQNTASGVNALGANSIGSENTADGFNALAGNSTGTRNTASGYHALYNNGSGIENTADGGFALFLNAGGSRNTAVGYYSLGNNTAGSNNIALGDHAGAGITTGSWNIDIGHPGFSTDTNTIRIGGGQSKTFIDGISGTPVTGGAVVAVTASGQLGIDPAIGVWTSSGGNVYRTNGFVGIGTTAPARPLHIADGEPVINLQDTGHSAIGQVGYISYRNNSSAETAWVGYGTVTDPDFSIVNARGSGDIILNPLLGNVGIARNPTANKLEVEGTASKTAAGSWLANSDARIKTGVQTVTGALDKLSRVRLVEFHYTEDYRAQHPSLEDRSYLNVVAQEFQKVFPDHVQSSGEKLPGSGDPILQVDTYPLTIYSAAAIQELNRKVEQKETEIAELKQRLEKLERLMNGKKGGAK